MRNGKCGLFGLALTAFTGAFLSGPLAAATQDPAATCQYATWIAAKHTGVPIGELHKVSRSDLSDKTSQMPVWPWTVSVEGTHVWFENAGQAQRHVFRNFRNGVRNFAIGCFQINYLSGSSAFSSIEDMFNPVLNAQYAARRLQTHYNQLGNWPAATQAFRQNGRSYAKRHISRFAVQGEAKKLLSSRSHALETERFPLLFGHGFPLEAPTSEPIAQRPTGSLFIAATEG